MAVPQPLPARVACRPIALRRPWSPLSGIGPTGIELSTSIEDQALLSNSGRQEKKAGDVLWSQLDPQCCPKSIKAEDVQILVEVAQPGR